MEKKEKQDEKIKKCQEEIQKILDKYDAVMQVVINIIPRK